MSTEQTEMGTEVATVGETSPAKAEGGSEVMALIRTALSDDVSVEKLERLMALKERYDAKEAKAAYLEALTDFQRECPEIPKTKGVSFDSGPGARAAYYYAPLDRITRIIDPILRMHGLSYSWTTEGMDGDRLNVVCILRHSAGHEERVPFPVPTSTNAKMSAAQKNGAGLTYGRRQSLIAVLGLSTTDDDVDGADGGTEIETITAEQAVGLEEIAEAAGVNVGAFCQWLGVPSIVDIPVTRFGEAKSALERKLAAKKGGAS